MVLHEALTHLDQSKTYVRMLFLDFSSAFNTVVPHKLPQHVRMGKHTSTTLILNIGTPQGCVLSPLLFSLFTHECSPIHPTNTIVKFADDTTIVGLIRDNDESAYGEVKHLMNWCFRNNLDLNIAKTKEMTVDYCGNPKKTLLPTLCIKGEEVERVESFKFMGVHISG